MNTKSKDQPIATFTSTSVTIFSFIIVVFSIIIIAFSISERNSEKMQETKGFFLDSLSAFNSNSLHATAYSEFFSRSLEKKKGVKEPIYVSATAERVKDGEYSLSLPLDDKNNAFIRFDDDNSIRHNGLKIKEGDTASVLFLSYNSIVRLNDKGGKDIIFTPSKDYSSDEYSFYVLNSTPESTKEKVLSLEDFFATLNEEKKQDLTKYSGTKVKIAPSKVVFNSGSFGVSIDGLKVYINYNNHFHENSLSTIEELSRGEYIEFRVADVSCDYYGPDGCHGFKIIGTNPQPN